MGRRVIVALLPLLLAALCLPARALTLEEAVSIQEDELDMGRLERSAAENGGMAEYGVGLDEGLAGLLDTGRGSWEACFGARHVPGC